MKNRIKKIITNNKIYNYVSNQKEKLFSFSKITQARFIGLAIFLFLVQLYVPIIASLKGLLVLGNIRPETVIAILGILTILFEKTYEWILARVSYSFIFKMIIFVNVMWIFGAFLYFISPTYFVWWDSVGMLLEGLVYLLFSTANSNYIHYLEPDDYTRANNFRNHLWLDVSLIGLFFSALITYFLGVAFSIGLIIVINIGFVIYQLKVLHLYKEKDFLYMLHYHRHLRDEAKKLNNKE